jgi:hypothetical protein
MATSDTPEADLVLTAIADCADCSIEHFGWKARTYQIEACETHSALLQREAEAETVMADGGHVLIRPANTRSDRIYHQPDPDDPDRPACVQGRSGNEARRYQRRDPDRLEEDYRLCSYCDPDWEVTRDGDDMQAYNTLADADDLDDLRADGGTVEIENPELFDDAVGRLKGIADDLDDLTVTASAIRDAARDLEAAARREVDDGE